MREPEPDGAPRLRGAETVGAPRGDSSGGGKLTKGAGTWATHAALLVVQFAFASQAVEAKVAMLSRADGGEEIFPEALAMMRMFGGAIVFQALVRGAPKAREAREIQGVTRLDHLKMMGLSVLGIALNQTLFLVGLKRTTPFAAALLVATIPVFAAALAVLFRKESASPRAFAGLSLALAGVLSLTGLRFRDDDLGALLVTLNSLCYAAYVVLSRDVIVRVGALRFMAWIFTWGAVLFAPIGATSMLAHAGEVTPRGWLFVGYIVLVPTILAYSLNAWALSRSNASTVTIYIYLQPLIAGVLARVQLGQAISPRAGLAAVLIFAGVSVVAFRPKLR